MSDEAYPYRIPDIAPYIKGEGPGRPGQAIRSWCRKGLITGFHQHSKNAEYRFSVRGVREAWVLWAAHKGLDPDAAMPKEIRKIIGSFDASAAASPPAEGERPTVRIEVPPGVAVEVVYKAA